MPGLNVIYKRLEINPAFHRSEDPTYESPKGYIGSNCNIWDGCSVPFYSCSCKHSDGIFVLKQGISRRKQ
jgi:hypothetical protein